MIDASFVSDRVQTSVGYVEGVLQQHALKLSSRQFQIWLSLEICALQ